MGWSCSAKAGAVLDAVKNEIDARYKPAGSNSMPDGGFYEIGRETRDGSITGKVWKPAPDAGPDSVRLRGRFKVSSQGVIERFPGLPSDLKRRAQAMGLAMFAARHGDPSDGSYKVLGQSVLEALNNGEPPASVQVPFDYFVTGWQRASNTHFVVLPSNNTEDMKSFIQERLV